MTRTAKDAGLLILMPLNYNGAYISLTQKSSVLYPQSIIWGFYCTIPRISKGNLHPSTGQTKGPVKVQLYSSFNLGARWSGWSTPRPGRFTPEKETPYPFYKTSGPVWTGAENLAHTGTRSPDRPARRKWLFWLDYRGPKVLRTSNRYLPKEHLPINLCNEAVLCFLCDGKWILKQYSDEFRS
jgi:hypothetical protein